MPLAGTDENQVNIYGAIRNTSSDLGALGDDWYPPEYPGTNEDGVLPLYLQLRSTAGYLYPESVDATDPNGANTTPYIDVGKVPPGFQVVAFWGDIVVPRNAVPKSLILTPEYTSDHTSVEVPLPAPGTASHPHMGQYPTHGYTRLHAVMKHGPFDVTIVDAQLRPSCDVNDNNQLMAQWMLALTVQVTSNYGYSADSMAVVLEAFTDDGTVLNSLENKSDPYSPTHIPGYIVLDTPDPGNTGTQFILGSVSTPQQVGTADNNSACSSAPLPPKPKTSYRLLFDLLPIPNPNRSDSTGGPTEIASEHWFVYDLKNLPVGPLIVPGSGS